MSETSSDRIPSVSKAAALPPIADRSGFEARVGELRAREKAHTRQGT